MAPCLLKRQRIDVIIQISAKRFLPFYRYGYFLKPNGFFHIGSGWEIRKMQHPGYVDILCDFTANRVLTDPLDCFQDSTRLFKGLPDGGGQACFTGLDFSPGKFNPSRPMTGKHQLSLPKGEDEDVLGGTLAKDGRIKGKGNREAEVIYEFMHASLLLQLE